MRVTFHKIIEAGWSVRWNTPDGELSIVVVVLGDGHERERPRRRPSSRIERQASSVRHPNEPSMQGRGGM